jgi:hypothetical protein
VQKSKRNESAWAAGVILAGMVLVGTSAQARKLYPVDEGPRDPSFLAFRNRLIAAAKNHDLRFVHSHLDPHVISSFGAGETIAAFKQTYEGKDADDDLWQALLTVLSLGGQFDGKHEFHAPYVSARFPEDLDVFTYEAIMGRNVRVRVQPSEAASVVETLSYDIVKVDEKGSVPPNSDNPSWLRITTPHGHKGYVAAQYLRSPVDYHASFKKRRGRWWITGLVAGE